MTKKLSWHRNGLSLGRQCNTEENISWRRIWLTAKDGWQGERAGWIEYRVLEIWLGNDHLKIWWQGFKLRARCESWERDECRCEGGANATGSGGHMEERWWDVPTPAPTFQSSSWQNLDSPGAWGASQDLLYSCFKQLFLSHHCQTCSQLRAQKRRYPLLAARQREVQIVELLNSTEGGLDIDRDLLSRAL